MNGNATHCLADVSIEEMMVYNFRAYLSPLLSIVGIPANILIIVVFCVMQIESPCRFNLYAIWLPIAHNLQLTTNAFLDDFLGRGLQWITDCRLSVNVDSISSFSCKLITYLTETSALIKACLLMYFSVDRVYSVYRSDKITPAKGLWVARLGVGLSYSVCMILSIPQLIYVDRVTGNDGRSSCEYVDPLAPGVKYVLYLYIIGATMFPSLLIFVTNLCIIFRMRTFSTHNKISGACDRKAAVEFGKVITHLAISVLFSCLSFPLVILIILRQQLHTHNYQETRPDYAKKIVELSRLFSSIDCINYACDFYFYIAFMPEFRKTLVRVLKLDRLAIAHSVTLKTTIPSVNSVSCSEPQLILTTHTLSTTRTDLRTTSMDYVLTR
ncbi:G-protein coupled receptor [Paragonimus heterotremus]|uniref:G-protein coupled receptor n=1 Tax=Paragonimus heterotremus TaxID=100268 RepID=A0A8J4SQS0_9TREM|nr:G-protein coupled receptor [Paragonimus heterotremus]